MFVVVVETWREVKKNTEEGQEPGNCGEEEAYKKPGVRWRRGTTRGRERGREKRESVCINQVGVEKRIVVVDTVTMPQVPVVESGSPRREAQRTTATATATATAAASGSGVLGTHAQFDGNRLFLYELGSTAHTITPLQGQTEEEGGTKRTPQCLGRLASWAIISFICVAVGWLVDAIMQQLLLPLRQCGGRTQWVQWVGAVGAVGAVSPPAVSEVGLGDLLGSLALVCLGLAPTAGSACTYKRPLPDLTPHCQQTASPNNYS